MRGLKFNSIKTEVLSESIKDKSFADFYESYYRAFNDLGFPDNALILPQQYVEPFLEFESEFARSREESIV